MGKRRMCEEEEDRRRRPNEFFDDWEKEKDFREEMNHERELEKEMDELDRIEAEAWEKEMELEAEEAELLPDWDCMSCGYEFCDEEGTEYCPYCGSWDIRRY